MRTLTARWVLPVTGGPIEDGAVTVEGGRILCVGRRANLAAEPSGEERLDLGEAALLPDLVNCHTHLELEASPPSAHREAFVPWVARLIEKLRATPISAQAATAKAGALALAQERVGLPADVCRRYLRERLCFDLGPRHLNGLQTFLAMLTESGAPPGHPSLSFISV
jgi:cytosine/adenosine deaminase-related metal-dependent hydrolase